MNIENVTIVGMWILIAVLSLFAFAAAGKWLGHKDRQWLGFFTVPLGMVKTVQTGVGGRTSFRMNYPGYWVATRDDCRRIRAQADELTYTRDSWVRPWSVEEGDIIPYAWRSETIQPLTRFLDRAKRVLPFGWHMPIIQSLLWYNFKWIESQSDGTPRSRNEKLTTLKVVGTAYFIEVSAVTSDNVRVKIHLVFNTETTNPRRTLVENDSWYVLLTQLLTKYLLEYVQSVKLAALLVETDLEGQRRSGAPQVGNPIPGKTFFEFAKQLNHELEPELDRPFGDVVDTDEGIVREIGQRLTGATIIKVINPEDRVWQAMQDAEAQRAVGKATAEVIKLTGEAEAAAIGAKGGAEMAVFARKAEILHGMDPRVAGAQVLGSGFKDGTQTIVIGSVPGTNLSIQSNSPTDGTDTTADGGK